jgi:hypothetical protein
MTAKRDTPKFLGRADIIKQIKGSKCSEPKEVIKLERLFKDNG